jgi:hypothetical protein
MIDLPDWLPSFLLTLLTAYSAALLLFPLIRRPNRLGLAAQWFAIAASIGSLFWLHPGYITMRGIAALFCTDLAARLIDFGRQTRQRRETLCGYTGFLNYIVPFPISMVVYGDKFNRLRERPPLVPELLRIAGGLAGFGVAFAILTRSHASEFLQTHFAADHCLKVLVWLLGLEAGSQFGWGVERLLGYADGPPMGYPSIARTPAEFWMRWNRRAQRWFYLNAFAPAGGKQFPVRGVVATFVVSGFIHELLFDIATSDFNGWQGLFFLIQIPAVLASRPLEQWVRRRGAGAKAAAHVATIVWFWMTSVLFFHGIEQVFPFFYAGESPLP